MIAGQPALHALPAPRPRSGATALVIAADRMPPPPGEVVTATDHLRGVLAGIVESAGGRWVGRAGAAGTGVRVRLLPDDEAGYLGHAERTIWPLYHDVCGSAVFDTQWRTAYRRVNESFAAAVAAEAAPGATVWLHDYHLQFVPGRLRDLRPDLRIGFQMHVPFPAPDLFMRLPMRRQVLDSLHAADVIGFQTGTSAENFLRVSERAPSSRSAKVGVYPTAVDTPALVAVASRAATQDRAARLRADLGSPGAVVVSIDSCDEISGIRQRLATIRGLLRRGQLDPADVAVVQVVLRPRIVERDLHDEIAREVARLNGEFATVGRPVVHFIAACPGIAERVALYRAADLMVATPLRDGANLFALEFAATAQPTGALVLSEFSGSSVALAGGAIVVNPHDEEQLGAALLASLRLGEQERVDRMGVLRRCVTEYDAHTWARNVLGAVNTVAAPGSRRHLTRLH
jgi:trehalose 6-phosphate synthase